MEEKLTKLDPKYSDIPDDYYITDFRKFTDFKKQTFNGYQKSDVLNALQKSITEQKLEEACHWAVEMLVSGHLMECWDRLILINSKFINSSNPNLPFYLWLRFSQAIQIIQDPMYQGERILQLRNNQECRNHLTDIVSVLTLSSKNKLKPLPKITSEDFRIDIFQEKLEAKSVFLIEKIIKPNDPSEINVVVNEFSFQLTERTGNLEKALYWFNWILEWERINVKKAEGFNCAIRNRKYIKPQYYHDIIWLIWDVIFQEATFRADEKLNRQLIGLFKLFKYNFTSPGKRKKSPLIVHAINLLSYHRNLKWENPITLQSKILVQANANTNMLYLEYKKKGLTVLQKKEEISNLVTRNNYLVSDQKISNTSGTGGGSGGNSSRNSKKNNVSSDVMGRINLLNRIDNIIINKNSTQSQTQSQSQHGLQYNSNPFTVTMSHTPNSYQNTENTIDYIQSIIN